MVVDCKGKFTAHSRWAQASRLAQANAVQSAHAVPPAGRWRRPTLGQRNHSWRFAGI